MMRSLWGAAFGVVLAGAAALAADKPSDFDNWLLARPLSTTLQPTDSMPVVQGGETRQVFPAAVFMRWDGANASLPDARTNLGLGTASNPTFSSIVLTPPSGTTKALNITQDFIGGPSDSVTFNNIKINTDNALAGAGFGSGLTIEHYLNGVAATGGREALNVFLRQTAITAAGNPNRNYVAVQGHTRSDSGDGGTGLTLGAAKGAYFGSSSYVQLTSGATNVLNAAGMEINWEVPVGASAAIVSGFATVYTAAHAVAGAIVDTHWDASGVTGGLASKNLILLNDFHGAPPLAATGCVICTDAQVHTIATGIDISSYTISGNFLKSANTTVTGSGAITTASFVVFSGGSSIAGNSAGAYPLSGSTLWSIDSNFSNANREVSFWNADHLAAVSFNWRQKTGASAATNLMQISPAGALTLTGNLIFAGASSISGNSAGAYPASGTTSWAIDDNFSNGGREVGFWNVDTAAGNSFVFRQKTGASASTELMSLSPAGVLSATSFQISGIPFATNGGGYTNIATGDGAAVAMLLGGAGDPANYYDRTTHHFRANSGGATFATITSAGVDAVGYKAGGTAGITKVCVAAGATLTFTNGLLTSTSVC